MRKPDPKPRNPIKPSKMTRQIPLHEKCGLAPSHYAVVTMPNARFQTLSRDEGVGCLRELGNKTLFPNYPDLRPIRRGFWPLARPPAVLAALHRNSLGTPGGRWLSGVPLIWLGPRASGNRDMQLGPSWLVVLDGSRRTTRRMLVRWHFVTRLYDPAR